MPTIKETIQKASEFIDLPEGWHFGEGVAPSQEAVDQALAFLEYANLSGIERANAFPGISGQVEVTFYIGDRMLEITIEADGLITIAEDVAREQISFEEHLSTSDAYQRLEEFSQSIWAFSDHFTLNITTQNVLAASPAVHWILEAENHFPWLIADAQSTPVDPYARILRGITTSKPESQKSTGRYMIAIYRVPAESCLRERSTGTTVTETFMGGVETPPVRRLKSLH